ncbi:MAG TPA: biopolymer transporter ExbD [Saprospiraceae bacterium]|nr:biopolymer transporter ExbD [Saprospiraceae bacterium]HMU03033.1 biopolymer transporter ExbD [Saprospiraceae bacterium]
MSKFKKKQGNAQPAISTASLPDIVFMLLFFFMVVTKMRDTELMVTTNTPQASELTKLEKKTLVNFIFIGRPTAKYKEKSGTKPRIQLGDKFATPDDIPLFLEKFKTTVPEGQRSAIISSMKVDSEVTMGIVGDVKTALRKAGQLKINYSAKSRERTQ